MNKILYFCTILNKESSHALIVLGLLTIIFAPLSVSSQIQKSRVQEAEDFNDNAIDSSAWRVGVLTRSSSIFDARVDVSEHNNRLVITPPARMGGWGRRGYVSLSGSNLTNASAAVEVVQVTGGRAQTIFSMGLDESNFYRFRLQGERLFMEHSNNGIVTSSAQELAGSYPRFWRIRHESSTDSVLFETSNNSSSWTERRSVPRTFAVTSLFAELVAGSALFTGFPGQAEFDNFVISGSGGPPPSGDVVASPTGSAGGNGSVENPWDIGTALSRIQPNQTLLLMPGVYQTRLRLEQPNHDGITVDSYDKRNQAVIDGYIATVPRNERVITIASDNITVKNLVLTNSITLQSAINLEEPNTQGNNPNQRGQAVDDRGTNTKLINCIIHDTGGGIYSFSSARNSTYYGNVIYNNGVDSPDRLHGQGLYTQNKTGVKVFEENIIFNNFESGMQLSGSSEAEGRNLKFKQNIFFNGGLRFLVPNISGLLFDGNHVWTARPVFGEGYGNPSHFDVTVSNNFLMAGLEIYPFVNSTNVTNNTIWSQGSNSKLVSIRNDEPNANPFTFSQNTYYRVGGIQAPELMFYAVLQGVTARDYAFNNSQQPAADYIPERWQEGLGLDVNSQYIVSSPPDRVVVKPNAYDPDKFTIIIYNVDASSNFTLDLAGVLSEGSGYRLRNVQDYFGDVITGTYSGPINLNMNRGRVKPLAYDSIQWTNDPLRSATFPKFGVFILERL